MLVHHLFYLLVKFNAYSGQKIIWVNLVKGTLWPKVPSGQRFPIPQTIPISFLDGHNLCMSIFLCLCVCACICVSVCVYNAWVCACVHQHCVFQCTPILSCTFSAIHPLLFISLSPHCAFLRSPPVFFPPPRRFSVSTFHILCVSLSPPKVFSL